MAGTLRAVSASKPVSASKQCAPESSVLSLRGLRVEFPTAGGVVRAVNGVSFDIRQGETVAVVGESGSGKSVTFLSAMGMVRRPGRIVAGSVELDGRDLAQLRPEELRKVRGKDISMVFQDPLTSLNPVFPIGRQLTDVIRAHESVSKAEAQRRAIEALDLVRIPEAKRRFGSFPHEFSGGMRQRVMIAMALVLRPRFVIADEPTTALDVTMQAQVLDLLHTLKKEVNLGLVMITHDLGVVARSADRVIVMYGGNVVEEGHVEDIFYRPSHPYTLSLMRSMPRIDTPRQVRLQSIAGSPPNLADIPSGCAFHPRCFLGVDRPICRSEVPVLQAPDSNDQRSACHFVAETRAIPVQSAADETVFAHVPASANQTDGDEILRVRELHTHFPVAGFHLPWRAPVVRAVNGVSFSVREGETIGLVGESGCGKSTLGRTLVRLNTPTSGTVELRGRDIANLSQRDMRALRTDIQMVFQDPYASLDPRMTIMQILREPFEAHGLADQNTPRRIAELMERVGLNPDQAERRPHEFSGGQRQRIGIARALALKPRLLILDEPVSALDVSVQAQIINLLRELQDDLKLTYIFIAHDLSVVRHICDRILVMYLGRIVEEGDRDSLFDTPAHPYTQALLSAVPLPDPIKERAKNRIDIRGSVPSPINPPEGCYFADRCPLAASIVGTLPESEIVETSTGVVTPRVCALTYPAIQHYANGQAQACHFPNTESTLAPVPFP